MSMNETLKEGEGKLAEVCRCGLLCDPRRISHSVMLRVMNDKLERIGWKWLLSN